MTWRFNICQCSCILSSACCRVCCRRYVIVDHSGVNAVDWQRGSNNVLALQVIDAHSSGSSATKCNSCMLASASMRCNRALYTTIQGQYHQCDAPMPLTCTRQAASKILQPTCLLHLHQAEDSEIEVYDNWRNQPGAMVVVDGSETTREKKLLSWAGELSAQRAELRQYKADLAMVSAWFLNRQSDQCLCSSCMHRCLWTHTCWLSWAGYRNHHCTLESRNA